MTTQEQKLLDLVAKTGKLTIQNVERRSDRPFDLGFSGQDNEMKCGFSAHLLRAAIRHLVCWTSIEVANMTDHPTMTYCGDWSGVRDTDDAKLWAIFDKFVLPQLK